MAGLVVPWTKGTVVGYNFDGDSILKWACVNANCREAKPKWTICRETGQLLLNKSTHYKRAHHRLVNALRASSGEKEKPFIRALEKMLSRFSTGTSYGIPIGPPASRLLAEAVLIDVDSTLLSFGFDFIRFVDDYIFFTDKVQDAEYCIRVLGETLFLNHGLTLQTSKTKISTASEYVQKHLVIHSDKEKNRRQSLQLIQQDDYEITSYDDLDEENKAAIDAFNLGEMLHEALGENENVNYREVQFILGRLSALQKPELIPIVLENLDRLYPVAESVAAFFTRFANLPRGEMSEDKRRRFGSNVQSRCKAVRVLFRLDFKHFSAPCKLG